MLLSECLQPNQDVIAQPTGDKLVLFDMNSGNYYSLNELGARIWELCDGSRTLGAVVDTLEAEYDAPREQIEEDSRALTLSLVENGLLVAGGQDSAASQ